MSAAPRYLYPVRKRLEIVSAAFAGGFGIHILLTSAAAEPLAWAGVHNGAAQAFGQSMGVAALIHAVGVRINGAWRWSPALRLTGMVVHTVLFAFLAWRGLWQTAGYTYGWITIALFYGALSAMKDTKRALGWEPEWKPN